MKSSSILLLLLVSCSSPVQEKNITSLVQQQKKRTEIKSPDHSWEHIFFKTINERARIAKLEDLRSTMLAEGDVEVRLWIGFGIIPIEGIVIRRRSKQWSATHIRSISPYLTRNEYQKELPPPKSGWEIFWKQITDNGILTLPDDSQLTDKVIATDGESFVVEINDGTYRTYKYSNPHLQKWPEAKQMIEIAKFIFNEFGIERPSLTQK